MQHTFVTSSDERWVEEHLDGSLRLLEMCTAAKDALIHTKECARELQSTMRRRSSSDMGLEREIRKYLTSRQVVKKAVQKALKSMELKHVDQTHEILPTVSTLREIQRVTTVIESLFSYIAEPKLQSKPSSWSVVSKLVHPKRVAQIEETGASDFVKVDTALLLLVSHSNRKSANVKHVENVHKLLGNLEPIIQDLEEGLESLFSA